MEGGVARNQSLLKKPLLAPPGHVRKFYGANLAEVFRTPLYDCSLKNVCGVPDFALTRLKGGSMEMQRAPAYPEDRAMLICVAWLQLRLTGGAHESPEKKSAFLIRSPSQQR